MHATKCQASCTCRERKRRLRQDAYKLAGAAGVDYRTAAKALELGVGALRARKADLVEEAARALGMPLPT